jgi:hypothetical protein
LRRKKEVIPEITNEVLVIKSDAFCKACKNNDIRILKDNLNVAVFTLQAVAKKLDIKWDDLEKVCAKIRKWTK